jgi:hypothetical protein
LTEDLGSLRVGSESPRNKKEVNHDRTRRLRILQSLVAQLEVMDEADQLDLTDGKDKIALRTDGFLTRTNR